MKVFLLALLMTVVSAAPQIWPSKFARQIDSAEYAATMYRTGELPLSVEPGPKANYPLPGTPEYAAMMLARSSAEKVEAKADYPPLPGTPEYAAMMLARSSAEKVEAKADYPQPGTPEYEAMMLARTTVDKVESKADSPLPGTPEYYAAMMAYQQKSDPAYYAAMAARTGEQPDAAAPTQPERFLLQNVTQLISIVQSAVKQELSSTINVLNQLKNNLTSLINQQKQNPVTVFVRDQQSSAQYPFNFEQKQQPVYILVRPSPGSSRPYYPASAFYPGPEYFFGNNRRFEKQLVADEVDYA